jgi:uncharacterized protein DUF3846
VWKRTRPPGKKLIESRSERCAVITAIVIPVNPKEPIRLEEIDRTDLSAYRRLVNGSLEVINLDRPAASLYFNGEGKFVGFPVNARATTLLWAHNSAFRGRDVIVGPAFIVGPVNRLGDDKTVPQDLIDLLLHTKRYRVQVMIDDSGRWSSNDEVFTEWFEAYIYGVQMARRWTPVKEVRVVPELDKELREQWYNLGIENPWISSADDPPFTRNSFVDCYSVEELEQNIGHGNWAIGTAFYYRDLCFIDQVEGGDEWLTIRHGIAFESMTLGPHIEEGRFARLIRRLLAATREQCHALTY